MPVDVHLDARQMAWYQAALCSATGDSPVSTSYMSADLLKKDRTVAQRIHNVPNGVWSGQIDLDVSQMVSSDGTATGSIWSAELTTIDPPGVLHLDSKALFLDRLLQITHHQYVPELLGADGHRDGYVDCVVFRGPCSAPTVAGDMVTLEAQGMDIWAKGAVDAPTVFRKGARFSDIIHDIWVNRIGEAERWLRIPTLPNRLPDNYRVGGQEQWWAAIQYLASCINCDAFYGRDAVGHLQQRHTHPVIGLNDGRNGAIVGIPQRSTVLGEEAGSTVESIRNRFFVIGQARPVRPPKDPPDGWKAPKLPVIRGKWDVPRGNKFSAYSLGHPDHPLRLEDTVTLEHVHTDKLARDIAEVRGRRRLRLSESITDETVVIPHLDAFDTYYRNAEGHKSKEDFLRSSMPLAWTPDNPQTISYTRRLSTAQLVRHRP